jgi:pimeloyl-ACP methyl ester carboxylesterase
MSVAVAEPLAPSSWLNRVQYPFESRFAHVTGGRMHYIDVGEGDPIVFLHGLPGWSFQYRHLIRGLSGGFRCIAPDLLGFGMSEKPANLTYSPFNYAENLAEFVDQLGLERFTLVMHDFGCPVGMSYAIDHPTRIRKAVVFNGFCWDLASDRLAARIGKLALSPAGRWTMVNRNPWAKWLRNGFVDKATFGETFVSGMMGPVSDPEDRVGLWNVAKCLIRCGPFFDNVWAERKELADSPFMFVWGMKDPLYGEKALNKWWHEFPLSDVTRLNNVGHFPMEEKPAETLRALREFLTAPVQKGFLA